MRPATISPGSSMEPVAQIGLIGAPPWQARSVLWKAVRSTPSSAVVIT